MGQYKITLELTAYVIKCFYHQKIDCIQDLMHEKIMWIGAAEGQYFFGKEQVVRELNEVTVPYCHVSQDEYQVIHALGMECMVVGKYMVRTDESSKEILEAEQRVTFLWIKVAKKWKILHMHVSNYVEFQEGDETFPNKMGRQTYEYMQRLLAEKITFGSKLMIKGGKNYSCVVFIRDIYYIEAVNGICEIHCKKEIFPSDLPLHIIQDGLPSQFIRIHRSYLVNIFYIRKIYRYEIILSNQDRIPVPEKKFNQVREQIIKSGYMVTC